MSNCYQCHATIRSPWKMGMTFSCQLSPGHGGKHSFTTRPITGEPQSVEWTGQEEKLTARATVDCHDCRKAAAEPTA